MRPVRRPSSQSWHLPPSERRELYLARHLTAARELVELRAIAAGADSINEAWRQQLEQELHRVLCDAWADGADREADMRTALDGERSLRKRMEALLRSHGIALPVAPARE